MKIRDRDGNSLSLTNDGQLSLFFVGCGSAFSKDLHQNNLLIVKGDDHVLIDCGTRAPEAFHKLGLPITKVKNFLITHSHADHIGGLEEVMLTARYVTKTKPTAIVTGEYQRMLWNRSLRGGCSYNETVDGRLLEFSDFWEIVRPRRRHGGGRPMYDVQVGDISLTLFRTRHFPEQSTSWKDAAFSVGVVIDNRILFTGDTQYDPDLIGELTEQFPIEVVFHDVQFFTGGVHSSLDEISKLPPEVKRITYLMHYSANWEQYKAAAGDAGFADFVRQWRFYDFD
jgi:ribonuclease BN (tRNA processing enzyme)